MSTNALARPVSKVPRSRRATAPKTITPAPRPEIVFPDVASIPSEYAMRLSGTCLAPFLNDGDEVVFSRDEPYKVGDICIFILRPEFVSPGGLQSGIKRLVMAPPPWVKFPWTESPNSDVHALVVAEQTNPSGRYHIACDKLLAVHKMVRRQARTAR